MAVITCEMTSLVLNTPVTFQVILPTDVDYHRLSEPLAKLYEQEKYRVLYFLHGAISSPGQILRYSNIERYAEECRLAVVLPYVGNSFYTNREEAQFQKYVSEELPLFIKKIFPISDRKEDTFIGGFSMGGYGAVKIGLQNPKQYGKIVTLSGVLDLPGEMESMTAMGLPVKRLFHTAKEVEGSCEDVITLLQKKVKQETIQPIYQSVGTEDFLYRANQKFRELCETNNLKGYHYEEMQGAHDWNFWETQIREMMHWLIQ